MVVICRDCGHVNDDDGIMQSDEKGRSDFIAGKYTPRYSCIKCCGKDIVSAD